VKGILHLLSSGALDGPPWRRWVHWSEAQARRVDEAAWAKAWTRVQPVAAWQPWPEELARNWLGLDLPSSPPPIPENVRTLLEKARPHLHSGR
jgi:hypothetical protein